MNARTEHSKFKQAMSWETFVQAITLTDFNEEVWMTLGGGEPTLHPLFVRFCQHILDVTEWKLGIVTNGSRPNKVRWLLKQMEYYRENREEERLHVALSLDDFHDRSLVKDWVVSAFRLRGDIREAENILRVGRAKNNPNISSIYYYDTKPYAVKGDRCWCPSTHIRPNGDVLPCGCDDVPVIGNVKNMEQRDFLSRVAQLDCCWHWEENSGADTWKQLVEQGDIDLSVKRENLVLTGDSSQ